MGILEKRVELSNLEVYDGISGYSTSSWSKYQVFEISYHRLDNYEYNYKIGMLHCSLLSCSYFILIFAVVCCCTGSYLSNSAEYDKKLNRFAAGRSPVYYDAYWHEQKVIHFISKPGAGYRLLEHFYTFIHLQDDAVDRYYKRFVRDYVHYIDEIFCKAAVIINKLRQEGKGHYSAFHIRR